MGMRPAIFPILLNRGCSPQLSPYFSHLLASFNLLGVPHEYACVGVGLNGFLHPFKGLVIAVTARLTLIDQHGRYMNEHDGTISCELVPGLGVSVHSKNGPELPAQVVTNSPDEAWLRLARPHTQSPFNAGDPVRIKYWDEGAVVYCWDGEISKVVGPDHQHVSIMITGPGVTLQRRRAFRVTVPIPLNFTVIDDAETKLVGEVLTGCATQNISVGGLKFDTELNLKVGDKLDANLILSGSNPVNVVGWVVRSSPVRRNGKPVYSTAFRFLQLSNRDQFDLMQFLSESEYSTSPSEGSGLAEVDNRIPAESSQ